jgi:hypothetical protein
MSYEDLHSFRSPCQPMTDRQVAEAQMRAAAEMLAKIDARPKELDFGDEAAVIWFKKSFAGVRYYTYTGVRAAGRWYLSGPKQLGKWYTWDAMMAFIFQEYEDGRTDLEPEIWFASEWTKVD